MKKGRFLILLIFLIMSLPYIYGGCVVIFRSGDVDKDKKETEFDSTVGFIGIHSQAEINSTNAENLASAAFTAGQTNVKSISSPLNRSIINSPSAAFRPMRLPRILIAAIRGIELAPSVIAFSQTNVMTKNGNFEGSCGGSFSYALEFDRVSQSFNGSILFEDYCDDGILVSGQTDVDGYFEIRTGNFITANFLFESLTDGYLTFEGEISIDFSNTPILVIFTAYGTDANTGTVYWIDDYSITLVELVGHIEIEVFGTFYHPDYGFVVLNTFDPFIVHDGDDWPTSGQLMILGDKATKARLTAIDQLHVAIEADTDGDGLFDWDSGLLSWIDL